MSDLDLAALRAGVATEMPAREDDEKPHLRPQSAYSGVEQIFPTPSSQAKETS